MNKLDKILKTPEDSDFRYFVEVDLKCPDNSKKEQRTFHSVLKI